MRVYSCVDESCLYNDGGICRCIPYYDRCQTVLDKPNKVKRHGDRMIYGSYDAHIEYVAEDDLFHGKLTNISKDTIIFQGHSMEELKQEFISVIKDYEDLCQRIGKKIIFA
jgi:hypothetical protein